MTEPALLKCPACQRPAVRDFGYFLLSLKGMQYHPEDGTLSGFCTGCNAYLRFDPATLKRTHLTLPAPQAILR